MSINPLGLVPFTTYKRNSSNNPFLGRSLAKIVLVWVNTSLNPSRPVSFSRSSHFSVYFCCSSSGISPIISDLIISIGSKSSPRLFITEKTRKAEAWLSVLTDTRKHLFKRKLLNLINSFWSPSKYDSNFSSNSLQFSWICCCASVGSVALSIPSNDVICTSWMYLLKKSWSFWRRCTRGLAGIPASIFPFSWSKASQASRASPVNFEAKTENKIVNVVRRCCPSITSAWGLSSALIRTIVPRK